MIMIRVTMTSQILRIRSLTQEIEIGKEILIETGRKIDQLIGKKSLRKEIVIEKTKKLEKENGKETKKE